jgi:hypothetical protein
MQPPNAPSLGAFFIVPVRPTASSGFFRFWGYDWGYGHEKTGGQDMVGGTGKNAINKLGEAGIQAFIKGTKAGKASKTKLSDGGGMNLMLTAAGTRRRLQRASHHRQCELPIPGDLARLHGL